MVAGVVEDGEGLEEAVLRAVAGEAVEVGGEVLEEVVEVEEDGALGVVAHGDAEHVGRREAEHVVADEIPEVVLLVFGEHVPAEQEPRGVAGGLAAAREAHDALARAAGYGVHAPEGGVVLEVRLEFAEVVRGHGGVRACVWAPTG